MQENLKLIDNVAHSGNYVPHDLALTSVELEKNTTVNGWSPLDTDIMLRYAIFQIFTYQAFSERKF